MKHADCSDFTALTMVPVDFHSTTCSGFSMRVLVIGAGPTTVHEHLPVLAKLRDTGEIVLSLVCDIDRERAAAARRKFGFLEDCGDGLAALQRTDIDAVYIFGSAQLHYEYGLLALEGGKHLFVEKPISPSYAQAIALADAARSRELIAVGGLNRRFFRSLTEVRERAGKAGWRYAEAVFHKAEFGNPPSFGAKTWLSANGIHALDALLFMMGGLPEQMTALSGESADPAPAAFSAIMRWRDGAQGVFLCNNNSGSRREEYVFHRQGETCSVDGNGLNIESKDTSTKSSLPMIGDGFAAEHAAFLRAIRTGAEPPHSLAAVAPSLFLAELIEAGFCGQVELPQAIPLDPRATRGPAEKSVLIAHSSELQPGLARLLSQYRLVPLEDIRDNARERPDIEGAILGRGTAPLSREVLDKLPRLRVVGVMALSLARHDPQALLERGIAVVNASAAYADSVAEFALGLAILGRRRAFASHAAMRAGGWGIDPGISGIKGLLYRMARRARPSVRYMGLEPFILNLWRGTTVAQNRRTAATATIARDLQGAVVGLLGWGENARAFAAHLLRLEARVLVYSEHARAEDIRAAGAAAASLAEVLSADVVSLHRGLTAKTRHFLGTPELAKLRAGTVLINTARGALIEPNALLARLRQGDIFACLDTFDGEPLPGSHPLRDLPNVFLTSHIAGGSKDMHAAAADEVIRKVAAYLSGDNTNSVSADRLSTMT
jgi:phosphoglycerate dehydrogenase-like enzyme/predicted dehydrogenase